MLRISFIVMLLFAAPAYALTDAQQTRLTLLERQLTYLEQQKAKALRAHDAWLNSLTQASAIPKGLPASTLFHGREDWSEALRTIWHISDKVYPDEAGPALATSPEAGLSEPERSAHRKAAMPEIDALEKRMTDEITALKATP